MKRTTAYLTISIFAALVLAGFIGCGGKPTLANLTAGELFERGKQKYAEKDYVDALEYFQAIVYNFPGESVVDSAQ